MAFVTGFVYVILAARENANCWYWGIISCGIWSYITFYQYDLYFDGFLQVFYVLMGFFGLYQWKFAQSEGEKLQITVFSNYTHALIIFAGGILSMIFAALFDVYTEAAATYLDATTTVFAIIATYLTVNKKLNNWSYWIIINIAYVYLYFSRGAILFAILYVIYFVIAINGYYNWRKIYLDKV